MFSLHIFLYHTNRKCNYVVMFRNINSTWLGLMLLTHLPLVPHICVSESGQHWFRWWLVTYSTPSYYLNQWWVIVNWTLRNKLQWDFSKKTKLFIHENASEIIVCEMAAILSRGRWVNFNLFVHVFEPCLIHLPDRIIWINPINCVHVSVK